MSLAPPWTTGHPADEKYRPTRDEILSYCKALVLHPSITLPISPHMNLRIISPYLRISPMQVQHPNIDLRLNTSCDHEKHQVTREWVEVRIGGEAVRASYLFVSAQGRTVCTAHTRCTFH